MLLKHVCEHCNGKLSFDNNPDAVGTEIECGHCHEQTVLSPSTFSTETVEDAEITSESEDVETDAEKESGEELSDGGEDKSKRRGPPRPRASRRGSGPPRPRKKKADLPNPASEKGGSESAPEKIGRRLAGSAVEDESDSVPAPNPKPKDPITQSRPSPTRSSRIESVEEARAPSPRKGAVPEPQPTESEPPTESGGNPMDPMDPMGDVVPGSSAENPRPVSGGGSGPAPVQRRIAGMGVPSGSENSPSDRKSAVKKDSLPQPVKRKAAEEEKDGEPRSIPKWAMALGSIVLLLAFVYFLLPTAVEIFNVGLARDIRKYTRFQFGGPARTNSTEDFKWDNSSISLSPPSGPAGVMYITGSILNKSDNNYREVEVEIELYDAQGQLLGHTMDYTNQLGSNLTWSFKAACSLTNAAGAKIAKVVAR